MKTDSIDEPTGDCLALKCRGWPLQTLSLQTRYDRTSSVHCRLTYKSLLLIIRRRLARGRWVLLSRLETVGGIHDPQSYTPRGAVVATPRTCSVKGLFSPYRSPRSVRPFLLSP